MATSVFFNGKMRKLPGAYATVSSGESNFSRALDYGTVLLIDTGVYGAGFGGGSGVNGTHQQGKNSVYEFRTLQDFREFVKGGVFWKASEALFNPDPYNPDAVGISKLLYVRACTTTPATLTFTPTGGGSNGGNFVVKTIDEGLCANGETEGNLLKKGYAMTIEKATEVKGNFIMKFWLGTYTGKYRDPVTGTELSYDELTLEQSEPYLIAETPEFSNMSELIKWCQEDENFGSRFVLDSTSSVEGNGSIDDTDITSNEGWKLFAGGSEQYKPTDIDDLLKQITDIDYNIVFTDQVGASGASATNLKVIAHRNTQAKFDKFVYIGAYDNKSKFNDSLEMAKKLNNAYVVCVHGGIGTASDSTSSKSRWWGVFYNLCQVIGRVSGKPPYIPVTNKTIGGDFLQHIPDEKEMEKALEAGLLVVFPNPYISRFTILQGVTTLQDNKTLFNKKGLSHSIQFMRIISQLNKECVVNAHLDLLSDENGVNMNTLSKGSIETWVINFLQSRTATPSQDNLIQRFQNVVATRVEDTYHVTYEVVLNSELTKLFFTGFLLKK